MQESTEIKKEQYKSENYENYNIDTFGNFCYSGSISDNISDVQ